MAAIKEYNNMYLYEKQNDGIAIKGYIGRETNIVIPEQIEDTPVTFIGQEAFCPWKWKLPVEQVKCRENLESVIIPDSVTSIGDRVFKGCINLTSVVLSKNLLMIPQGTFNSCENLISVDLPDKLEHLGASSFSGCNNLNRINLPASLVFIGESAFYGCENLDTIILDLETHFDLAWKTFEDKQKMCILGKAVKEKSQLKTVKNKLVRNKEQLMRYAIEADDAELIECIFTLSKKIPLEDLDNYIKLAMSSSQATAVILAYKSQMYSVDEQEKKESDKFEKELGLKSRTVAEWKKLYTFDKCKDEDGLIINGYKGTEKHIIVPDKIGKQNVAVIGEEAFSWRANRITAEQRRVRKAIESIQLSKNVVLVEQLAFSSNESLKTVILPEGIECVRSNAFAYCEKLVSVNLPNSIRILEHDAFCGCTSLEAIEIPTQIKEIDVGTFDRCESLKHVVIPNNITIIGYNAFARCTNLESIEIPKETKIISNAAFDGCDKLVIHAPEGSYAETFAKKNGINFVKK